jgi:hypothetical protein
MAKGKKNIENLIDKLGLLKTKEALGISLTKLVKLVGLMIHPNLAGEMIIEGINNETLPTEYKEFKISTNSDGVVYWEGKFYGDHFLPNIVETIWIMATPFWDSESYTPIESDWYSLVDGSKNKLIDEIESGGEYFESITDKVFFDNVDDLYDWYNEFYLPSVYRVIMDNFLPSLRQEMDDRLDDNMGYSPIRESIVRVIREETEGDEKFDKVGSFVKRATKLINTIKFPAVKRIGFDYDEMMDGYHVNIFFDRQFSIDNPKNFNKVKQEAVKEIGSTVTSYFPYKFYFYLHYE